MKHTIYIAVFFLYSCANVVAPTGGPKDMNPPQLLKVTPNNKTPSVTFSASRLPAFSKLFCQSHS